MGVHFSAHDGIYPASTSCVTNTLNCMKQLLQTTLIHETREACYVGYYSKRHMQAALSSTPQNDYKAATDWVSDQQQRYGQTVI